MDAKEPLVLVVDDVVAIVEELLTFLALQNIPAVGAHTLDEAIAALERCNGVCVIACDVRLGRESGLEIIDRIGRNAGLQQRQFHYVFVSGDPMRMDHLPDTPHHSILTKPVQPQALVGLFRQLISKKG